MNKEELIKHIQEKATTSDLVEIADMFNIKMDMPDNINGKYFYLEGGHYVKVLDSKYNSKFDEYEINKCLYVFNNDIALDDIDPINLTESEEISKEEFVKEYNKVLAIIQKNL